MVLKNEGDKIADIESFHFFILDKLLTTCSTRQHYFSKLNLIWA